MLGVLNIRPDLKAKLSQHFEVTESGKIDGLFIDWVPKSNDDFAKQAVMVEEHVKRGIPTVIYDRYLNITTQEYMWLRKFNVTFFEPVINHRAGFEFLPQWTEPYKWKYTEETREIDLAFNGVVKDKIASFEKYYGTYASLFPDKRVIYEAPAAGMPLPIKTEKWANNNLVHQYFSWDTITFTVLIGTLFDYKRGYLREDLFEIMRKGVIPLCPIEHRFYGSMFQDLVIKDERDLDYYVGTSPMRKVGGVLIEGIFDNMLKYYPEFSIDYTVDRLKECFK
jgi:hypothetical protein